MVTLSVQADESATFPTFEISAAIEAEIVALRSEMLRFARLQMHDREQAEDLVQDSIEAALLNSSSFEGRSSVKTWMFAILRHRIVDHRRKAARSVNLSSLVADGSDPDDCLDVLFNEEGGWCSDSRPAAWQMPDEALQSTRFRKTLEASLQALPSQARRVFMMREVQGLETSEICAELGISTSNCNVILHRARTRLRHSLAAEWDGRSRKPDAVVNLSNSAYLDHGANEIGDLSREGH